MFTRVVSRLLVGLAVIAFGATAPGEHSAHAADGRPGEQPANADSADRARPEHSEQRRDGGDGSGKINPVALEKLQAELAIWTAVVFLVLLAILRKFAWGPLTRGLKKREQRIADEIASAERSNAGARELLEEYQQRLAASREEVQQMLQAAQRDAKKVGHGIVEKARAEAQAEQRQKLEEIEMAADGAIKKLGEQSATLAVELAGKIVAAKLDPKEHLHLIEQAVTKFSTQQPGAD